MTRLTRLLAAVSAAAVLAAFGPSEEVSLPTSGNATPAFDAAVAAACASPTNRTIRLPAGTFSFDTAPASIPCALNIGGEGLGTVLVRNYSGGYFLNWVRGTDHSGGSLRDTQIVAKAGTTGGIAVTITATPDTNGAVNSYNRHSFMMEGVIVGRDAPGDTTYWDFGLYLDGSANPDGNPNSVPGIRGVWVDKSTFGGAKTASVYLNKARGADLKIECYTPILGGFAGVMMANGTQGVWLHTRNCGWSKDGSSTGMILNGTAQP